MYKKYFFFLFLTLVCFYLKSQTTNSIATDSTVHKKSSVTISKDHRIDNIIETHKKSYKEEGYRIQIFSGNKRQPAREAKARYINLRHKNKAHEIYQQPYFKVRVGDFRTKLEALKFQKELTSQFPNCFIVKDEIDIEQLLE